MAEVNCQKSNDDKNPFRMPIPAHAPPTHISPVAPLLKQNIFYLFIIFLFLSNRDHVVVVGGGKLLAEHVAMYRLAQNCMPLRWVTGHREGGPRGCSKC